MTDQQRFDTIAAASNSVIKTPNLDRLAAMGVTFTHATTPCPVCGPARHALFSGVKCDVSDFDMNISHWRHDGRYFPEMLTETGIRTGGFGKFHFWPERTHPGFMHYAVHEEPNPGAYREDMDYIKYLKDNGLGYLPYTYGVTGLLYFQPQRSLIPEEHHQTKWIADRALEFIETFHRDSFFLYASWEQPHFPVDVPERLVNLYPDDEIEVPVFNEKEQLPWLVDLMRNASDMFDDGKPAPMERIKRSKALYYASISYIDEQIGRILDALDVRGILDQALIIFTADHGELLGDHRSYGKLCGYDPSVRIPFVMAAPELDGKGTVSDDFVSLYDILPTILDFAGADPDPLSDLIGCSILSHREEITARDKCFFEIGNGRDWSSFMGVRTRRWKYVYYFSEGLKQLFDLDNDPNELNNLYLGEMTGEYKNIAAQLHQNLLDWNRRHGYPERLDGDDFKVLERGPDWKDRNSQFNLWTLNLIESEKKELWSEAKAVYEAIKDEPSVDPAELDLKYWESKRGSGCIAELESLTGRKLCDKNKKGYQN